MAITFIFHWSDDQLYIIKFRYKVLTQNTCNVPLIWVLCIKKCQKFQQTVTPSFILPFTISFFFFPSLPHPLFTLPFFCVCDFGTGYLHWVHFSNEKLPPPSKPPFHILLAHTTHKDQPMTAQLSVVWYFSVWQPRWLLCNAISLTPLCLHEYHHQSVLL